MALNKRALRVNFSRAVTGDGPPVVMEVAVNPLSVPSAPDLNATLITRETQDVLLDDNATVTFMLVPTDHPDLTERVTYRIAWREKYLGRVFAQDFVMPDFDVDFDDLQNLGNLIGGVTYVQWADVGRVGGVAALNAQGQVVDADGNVVSGTGDAAQVQGHLDAEINNRLQADNTQRQFLTQFIGDQITQVYASAAQNLSNAVGQLQNADTTEKAQRQQAVALLNNSLDNLANATNAQVTDLNELIDDIEDTLVLKADLVGGKIPSAQLPNIALGKAVTVANEAAMLALTSNDVQPGDFAVRSDGIFFLNAAPPSSIGNWIRFQVSATVLSVNGQTGAVVLSAADVGARAASAAIAMSDITGLSSALTLKTDATITNAINARLQVLENDTTIVRTSAGAVPRSLMGTFLAYINDDGQITRKDGTVLNLGGGGGDLDIEDVTGLTAALAAKVNSTDPSVTNARTPTAHAASHATGGTDAITPAAIGARAVGVNLAISDITGLQAILTDNSLTSTSNLDGRISSAETRIEDLELGGGGGGGGAGASGKTVWYSASGPLAEADFDDILIRSPFGYDGSVNYYDPAGVDPGEAVWPYITPNGHLELRARNETAPADAVLATQADLSTLTTTVGTKASQTDLDTANAAINTKASLSALSTLTADVATRATTTALNSLSDIVATKASQSALDTLTTTVGTKASQSALDTLTTTVGTKASSTTVGTLSDLVGTLQTGKADLSAGKVPIGQVPDLPLSQTTGLVTALSLKADLSGGLVPLTQLPSYPTSKVTGLDSALSAKADLVSGLVPTNQLPALALNTVVPVANRAAMLALNTGQVQPGDLAVITATVDKGSYILTATDPSVFSNWVKLVAPDDVIVSVNGQIGTVVLGPADVGARAAGGAIAQSEITGLVTALGTKADSAATTTALNGKTSPTDVTTLISQSSANKQRVDYAASTAVASLSGQQSIDGVLVALGSIVLLTAQSSSVNNGVYTVNSGAWTRVADMATGDFFVKGTQVVVNAASNPGSNHNATVWLETNTSGVVGTNANNWTKALTAGAQPVFTAINGVQKIGNEFSAKVVTGGGIQAVSGGLQLDPNIATRKFAGDVPGGSAIVTITHNLNSTDVIAQVRDKSSGDVVLLGWKPTGVNTISLDFGSVTPTSGQWRVTVVG